VPPAVAPTGAKVHVVDQTTSDGPVLADLKKAGSPMSRVRAPSFDYAEG
jgi:hypothetical protein